MLRAAANKHDAAGTRTELEGSGVSEGIPPLHGAEADRRWAEDVLTTLESHSLTWKGLKPEDQAAKAAELKEAERKRREEEIARRESEERKRLEVRNHAPPVLVPT